MQHELLSPQGGHDAPSPSDGNSLARPSFLSAAKRVSLIKSATDSFRSERTTSDILLSALTSFFRSADRNGDGQLTETEFNIALDIFHQQKTLMKMLNDHESDGGYTRYEYEKSTLTKSQHSKKTLETVFGMDYRVGRASRIASCESSDDMYIKDTSFEKSMQQLDLLREVLAKAYDAHRRANAKATPSEGEDADTESEVGLSPKGVFDYLTETYSRESGMSVSELAQNLVGVMQEASKSLDSRIGYEVDKRVLAWPIYFFLVCNMCNILRLWAKWGIEDYENSLYHLYAKCEDIQTKTGGYQAFDMNGNGHIAQSYTIIRDGNALACYLMAALTLTFHGVPVCMFMLELWFPKLLPRRLHSFKWTMKKIYTNSYADVWRAAAFMYIISIGLPIGAVLQHFLPGHVISNDEASINGVMTGYYVMTFVMLVSGILASRTLTGPGRITYARERYYLRSDCPVEVPYESDISTMEDVYFRFQQNYANFLYGKKYQPKGKVEVALRMTLGVAWERATNLKPTAQFLWFVVPALFYASIPVRAVGGEQRFCWGSAGFLMDMLLNQLNGWPSGFAVYFFQLEIAKITSWYLLRVKMMTMMKDCISHTEARNSLGVPEGEGVPFVPLQVGNNLSSWLYLRGFMLHHFEAENIARSEIAIAGVLCTEVVTMVLFIWFAYNRWKAELFYITFLLAINTMYITRPVYSAVLINEEQAAQRDTLIDQTFSTS